MNRAEAPTGNTLQLTLATGAFAVCFAVFGSVSAMMPILRKKLDLDPLQVSIALAIPVLLGSLGRIPIITDRIGGRKVFSAVMAVSIIPALLMGWVSSYVELLLYGFFCACPGVSVPGARRPRAGSRSSGRSWPRSQRMRPTSGKFEEIGTHPATPRLAIGEALLFHAALGGQRKTARLRYLPRYWMTRLREFPRLRFHTSFDDAQSCGIGTVEIEGIDPGALASHLMSCAQNLRHADHP